MLAEISTQQALVWGGLLMVAGYIYFRMLRVPERQREPFERFGAKAAELTADRQTGQPPPEINRWQIEMLETSREMKAELDSKMLALNVLIRSAREEQERLAKLIEQAESLHTRESP